MQRRSGEKTTHIETIITKGIKFSPLQAGSLIGLQYTIARDEGAIACHTLAGRRRHLGDHAPIASGRKSAKLKEADFQLSVLSRLYSLIPIIHWMHNQCKVVCPIEG